MNGRRIDLSATQVIASMLAAVTGAVAASYLGVAGTVVGAAVMSVASTAIASVYKHYLGRSRERLRAAREVARTAPEAAGHFLPQHRAAGPGHDMSQAPTRTDLSRLSRAERGAYSATRPAGPDAEETQVFPAVASGPHRWDASDRANGLDGLADGATQIVRRPDHAGLEGSPADGTTEFIRRPDLGADTAGRGGPAHGPHGAGAGARDAAARDVGDAGAGEAGAPQDARWRRPRPLVLAGIALGVFLLAMAGITAFEAVAGKPLDAIVGSGHGSGTTVGSIVGGSGHQTVPRHTAPARPSQAPSPTPRASTSPSPTPAPTPTPTPTPSPAPSDSPGASPATPPSAPANPADNISPLASGAP